MGEVGNGAAEEDWCWDLNSGAAALRGFLGPHGFGLTGDYGSNTEDGAGTEGLPESWTSTSFPEIRYPRLGQGEKEGLCAFVGILKNISILMKPLSHYSKSV